MACSEGDEALGALAFSWQLKSPNQQTVCSGAGRDAMVFDTGGHTHTFDAGPEWINNQAWGGPAENGVFSAITPSIPTGEYQTSVRMMNTQDNSVRANTTLATTVVGGRTALAEHFVFLTGP